jgi:hypothetical protein
VATPGSYVGKSYAQVNTPPALSGTTFPPLIFHQNRNQSSYVITIPFVTIKERRVFDPIEANIPTGMTVIWFTDDSGEHSIVTNTYLLTGYQFGPYSTKWRILYPHVCQTRRI